MSESLRDARASAERAARDSYGRLLAILIQRTRDIAAAEDALAESFRRALETWPSRGVPDAPEAWLLTVARRTVSSGERHRAVRDGARVSLEITYDEMSGQEESTFPDERLKLLFTCAHPAIDPAIRTPLMLQTVLGFDAVRIGNAFLTAPTTMGQRLVRAKKKIRDAGLRVEEPPPERLGERLSDVLAAIYAAYGTGWDAIDGLDAKANGLAEEALFLGRLVTTLLPVEPEPMGLLALMLYCEARAPARRGPHGEFVPLSAQDPGSWSKDALIEAEWWLMRAAQLQRTGRFQTEAAIQSLHCQSRLRGEANGAALVQLYDLLCRQTDALGAQVSRAVAYGEHRGPAQGLMLLDALPNDRVAEYQPYWAARAHLMAKKGEDPGRARERALALTRDPAVRTFLAGQA